MKKKEARGRLPQAQLPRVSLFPGIIQSFHLPHLVKLSPTHVRISVPIVITESRNAQSRALIIAPNPRLHIRPGVLLPLCSRAAVPWSAACFVVLLKALRFSSGAHIYDSVDSYIYTSSGGGRYCSRDLWNSRALLLFRGGSRAFLWARFCGSPTLDSEPIWAGKYSWWCSACCTRIFFELVTRVGAWARGRGDF